MRLPYRKPGKFSSTKFDPLLTKKKFDQLQTKLERLKKVSRPEAAEEVKRLAELGDFSENVEYQLAKGRLRGMNNTILKLEHQLNHADILIPAKTTERVQLGHTVTVEQDNKQMVYQILGSTETNPEKGVISHTSPIGLALLDKKVGDSITVKLPKKDVVYTIISIT